MKYEDIQALQTLKELHDSGFLEKEEYSHRKNMIIDRLTQTSYLDVINPPPIEKEQAPYLEPKIIEQVVELMTIDKKIEIANKISALDGEEVRKFMNFINEHHPAKVSKGTIEDEWNLDLKEFSDSFLWKLDGFIEELKAKKQIELEKRRAASTPPVDTNQISTTTENHKPETQDALLSSLKRESIDTNLSIPEEKIRRTDNGKFKLQVEIFDTSKRDGVYRCDAPGCEDRTFDDKSNLLKHIRTHTKEKPYKCSSPGCYKSFAHSSTLREHMNIHANKHPHVCTYEGCSKRFTNASNLTRHIRTHTGEKPYICSECGKGFAQSGNLKSHFQTVHNK